MIGIDTNVLLRLFLDDDPAQRARAARCVEAASSSAPAVVNSIVLSEFAWTLAKRYKIPRSEIAAFVNRVLIADDLKIVHAAGARRALAAYRRGKADFPDYFLASINAELGCSKTLTFDKAAIDFDEFAPVP